ncbi:MAG: RelA/SpoT family protein [bacterium]|nr:RelA/SpoT family protein [bacterium]
MDKAGDPTVEEVLRHISPLTKECRALLEKAYAFAKQAHAGQKRYSGEPYFNHIFAVATLLAEMKMDPVTIAAGFLHDALEDAHLSEEELEREFGKEIVFLVKGVTKLGKLKYRGLERHTESLRKFFIAMAQDFRVLIIKLCDRLHNAKTLEHVPKDKRARIALETIEIHARLADRLGMGKLRSQLEDAAFPHAFPEEYKKVKELLKEQRGASEKEVEKIHRILQKELAAEGIVRMRTESRLKHLYSLWKKLEARKMDITKVYDLVALRVIVESVEDCYRALGIIHRLWRPLPGRIKDYIALPKPNGYRSLHTTIFTGDGGIVEIQIRTEAMHQEAEYGIASHLFYKEEGEGDGRVRPNRNIAWVEQLLDWQKQVSHSGEFLEHLKMDFFKYRVFVFTPKGDVIDLPDESSPIDFAYAIHSDIGDHTSGAKVNGKLVPLDTKLKNGDIVEIETKKNAAPKSKWLEYAKTTVAKRHIRNFLEDHSPLRRLFGERGSAA